MTGVVKPGCVVPPWLGGPCPVHLAPLPVPEPGVPTPLPGPDASIVAVDTKRGASS